jgi:glycosyltransferase involved in cell wall biosynthesis
MVHHHRRKGTWNTKVNCFIACTHFAKQKFRDGGLPASRIFVKPNLIYPDPQPRQFTGTTAFFLFAGRLSQEKGIFTLLKAWRFNPSFPLKIAGDGPLRSEVERLIHLYGLKNVEVLGHVSGPKVMALLNDSVCLVFPSECYENFPLSIGEAYACAVPVIATRLGAMEEIVKDGKTGLHFTRGDPEDLSDKVQWAWSHAKDVAEMGLNAREEFEQNYTASRNHDLLVGIYKKAIALTKQPERSA